VRGAIMAWASESSSWTRGLRVRPGVQARGGGEGFPLARPSSRRVPNLRRIPPGLLGHQPWSAHLTRPSGAAAEHPLGQSPYRGISRTDRGGQGPFPGRRMGPRSSSASRARPGNFGKANISCSRPLTHLLLREEHAAVRENGQETASPPQTAPRADARFKRVGVIHDGNAEQDSRAQDGPGA